MDRAGGLTDRIRDWFEHTPRAQRAIRRLSADLDAVVAWVDSSTGGLQKKIAPWIDPTAKTETDGQTETSAELAETGTEPTTPEAHAGAAPEIDAPSAPGTSPQGNAPESDAPKAGTPETSSAPG